LPGIDKDTVNVYVLGPPKNEELLYDKDPKKDETYDTELAVKSVRVNKLVNAIKQFTQPKKKETDKISQNYVLQNIGATEKVMAVSMQVPMLNISPDGSQISTVKKTVTAIPYYAWANRGKTDMTVWMNLQR